MTQSIRLQNEFSQQSANSGFKYFAGDVAGLVAPATDIPAQIIQFSDFSKKEATDLPSGWEDINDVIADLEKDPSVSSAISDGRKWVAESFYRDQFETLASLRLKKGWSQARLAAEIGTQQPHIARIEAGRTDPQLSTIEKLASALEVDLVTLIAAVKATGNKVVEAGK